MRKAVSWAAHLFKVSVADFLRHFLKKSLICSSLKNSSPTTSGDQLVGLDELGLNSLSGALGSLSMLSSCSKTGP